MGEGFGRKSAEGAGKWAGEKRRMPATGKIGVSRSERAEGRGCSGSGQQNFGAQREALWGAWMGGTSRRRRIEEVEIPNKDPTKPELVGRKSKQRVQGICASPVESVESTFRDEQG